MWFTELNIKQTQDPRNSVTWNIYTMIYQTSLLAMIIEKEQALVEKY